MALNHRGIAPVDRLLAVFNLIMAAVWVALLDARPAAPWLCLAHGSAAALPWLIGRARRPLAPPVLVLRQAYPLLWLLVFWTEVDFVRHALHTASHDALISALDVAVFGTALHSVAQPLLPSLWISEPLHFSYFAYYATIPLPLLVLALRRRTAAFDEAMFRLLLTFTTCFLAYALFPVDGPQRFGRFFDGPQADGFWYGIVHVVNSTGGALGAAFPSSHVAGAVTVAYLGWSFLSRPLAVLLTVQAAGVFLATFYTQYHYAIDSVAGLLVALVVQLWLAPALLGWQGRVRPSVPVPRLPVRPDLGWGFDRAGAER